MSNDYGSFGHSSFMGLNFFLKNQGMYSPVFD